MTGTTKLRAVIVCGSRDFIPDEHDETVLRGLLRKLRPAVVLHGDYRGADKWAEFVAIAEGLSVLPFPADWNKLGSRAGPLRNEQMAVAARGYDSPRCIAFPGGEGTANMVGWAKRKGIPVIDLRATGAP